MGEGGRPRAIDGNEPRRPLEPGRRKRADVAERAVLVVVRLGLRVVVLRVLAASAAVDGRRRRPRPRERGGVDGLERVQGLDAAYEDVEQDNQPAKETVTRHGPHSEKKATGGFHSAQA